MKILVDADACPVVDIIVYISKKYNLELLLFVDTSHILNIEYGQVYYISKGVDAVDIALINKANKGDIVITQDYGVATMTLGRGGYCINQNGFLYTNKNIDSLLMQRHLAKKIRKYSHPKKRTKEQNEKFKISFENLVIKAMDIGNNNIENGENNIGNNYDE